MGLDFLVWAAALHLMKEQFENMVKTNHLEKGIISTLSRIFSLIPGESKYVAAALKQQPGCRRAGRSVSYHPLIYAFQWSFIEM